MKFSDSHEWIKLENGNIGVIGVTDHAQRELGDIVYVELPIVGKYVKAHQEVAVLESTKAAVDVYSPVSGLVIEINHALSSEPELINRAPEEEGWIYKILLEVPQELEVLLERDVYHELITGSYTK